MTHRRRVRLSVLLVVLVLCAAPNRGRCEEAPAPKAAPTMTEELMARLFRYTREVDGTGALDVKLATVLEVWSGSGDMPLKLASADDESDGVHYFGLPLDVGSRDVLIMVKRSTRVDAYLTDKTGTLRAAAVLEGGKAHLVTNEKAAEKFKAALALFAKEAAEQLPPAAPELPQWRGPDGGGSELSTQTLTTQQAWLRLWARLDRPAPQALDEARDMAVFVAVGERPTGGFRPKILSATARDGKLVVVYTDGRPAPKEVVTQALTHPWVVAVVPKSALPVVLQAQDAK